ncbi:GyrI-like domain-containing protein [Hymenobacter elongatus]|uniref:AraC family transcriptional regulator n=1 Tax=Hymenobacter elongatus TaxID=877208 RepID=A0A4Z0PID8_9BACT|nr:GyrI-like domain-containing protein [Hymenobacter elongatus]TGE14932.1 AraC family transcriptional regulator [Hymenobacter elongatus]
MTRWLFLLILVLTVGAAIVYGYLGGFTQPTVAIITTKAPVFLAGKAFRGSVRDEAFGPMFRQVKEAKDNGQLRGDLANIYYNNPEKARDTVQAFVGLVVADTVSQQLPAGYRYRTFAAGQRVIQARTTASYLVAPNKLYPAIADAAQQQKLQLQQVYLERFPEQGESEVLAAVK